uniref:PA domain-containing protein n=1 Tax=Strigamia maritima TaxID=126957 RepID=T1IK40_STRMM
MTIFYLFLIFLTRCTSISSLSAVLHAQSSENEKKFCVQTHSGIGKIPTNQSTPFYPLVNMLPWDACEPPTPDMKNMSGGFPLVIRYPCAFLTKANIVQAEGARGLIVNFLTEKLNDSKPSEHSNATVAGDLANVTIPVVFMTNESAVELLALGDNIRVKVFSATKERLEYSHIIVWLWACSVLTGGSYWCGMIHAKFIRNRRRRRVQLSLGMSSRPSSTPPRSIAKNTIVTIVMIGFAVLLMSSLLLLLYFYYIYIIYFVLAVFAIACFVSTIQLFDSFFKYIKFTVYKFPSVKILGNKYTFTIVQVFLVIASLTIVIYWLIIRKNKFAWILQDILGTIFCVNLLRTLRLPNAMIVTILCLVLIFYDVFFVFITPYLTASKESVMVQVATSGGKSGEQVPMIFLVPHIKLTEVESACKEMPLSMLGYGDVLIPGYAIGLCVTFAAMLAMNKAQPALLYLVPCTLIPIYIVAFVRKEAKALWLGRPVLSPNYVRTSVAATATVVPTESTGVSAEPEEGHLLTPR